MGPGGHGPDGPMTSSMGPDGPPPGDMGPGAYHLLADGMGGPYSHGNLLDMDQDDGPMTDLLQVTWDGDGTDGTSSR